jgi:transposase-like protein
MRKRTWDAKTKALIVLEGLKGKPGGEICTRHQISQSQYYPWRDGATNFWRMRPMPLRHASTAGQKPALPRRTLASSNWSAN